MTLKIDQLETLSAVRAVATEWHDLAVATSAQPTMTPAYAINWWEHQGQGDLHVLTARRDGVLVGLAPLHRRSLAPRGPRTLTFVRWLGHGTGSVGHVIAASEDRLVRGALWEAIQNRTPGFDLVDIPKPELVWMTAHAEVVATDRCPTAALEPGWTVEDYLRGGVRKRARRELARTTKRLTEGNATSRIARGATWADIEALLPDLLTVYDAAEDEVARLHLLQGHLLPFFGGFLKEAAGQGLVDVFVGYVNDEPAAFDILITVGTVSHTILGRYHPAAREWGVGHLLMEAMAARACARGSRVFNLQVGDDDYKRAWTDGGEDLVSVVGSSRGQSMVRLLHLRNQAFYAWRESLAPRLRALRS